MKSIAKIICCSVALAWMYSATADEDAAGQGTTTGGDSAPAAAAQDDMVVPTPPAPRIPVTPYRDKVDRAHVEKRIQDRADRASKRSAEAEKDVSERKAKGQQGQSNAGQNNQ